jgi:hypothetical protein
MISPPVKITSTYLLSPPVNISPASLFKGAPPAADPRRRGRRRWALDSGTRRRGAWLGLRGGWCWAPGTRGPTHTHTHTHTYTHSHTLSRARERAQFVPASVSVVVSMALQQQPLQAGGPSSGTQAKGQPPQARLRAPRQRRAPGPARARSPAARHVSCSWIGLGASGSAQPPVLPRCRAR